MTLLANEQLTSIDELRQQFKLKGYVRVDELLWSKHAAELSHGVLPRSQHTIRELYERNYFSIHKLISSHECAICRCAIGANEFCYKRIVVALYRSYGCVFYVAQKRYMFYVCSEACVEEAVKRLQKYDYSLVDFICDNELGAGNKIRAFFKHHALISIL
jgi:hypothetical protein